jgi:hypothetical protein
MEAAHVDSMGAGRGVQKAKNNFDGHDCAGHSRFGLNGSIKRQPSKAVRSSEKALRKHTMYNATVLYNETPDCERL